MSASIATVPAVVWQNKSGRTFAAHSATGAAFAPRAANIQAAYTVDLERLRNGQFRPLIADIRAACPASQTKLLDGLVGIVAGFTADPRSKADVRVFAGAVCALWERAAASKGKPMGKKQAALHAVVSAWEAECKAADVARTVPADTTDAPTVDVLALANMGTDAAPADADATAMPWPMVSSSNN